MQATGTIIAPDPVGNQPGSAIDVVQRLVITKSGGNINYRFDICGLTTIQSCPAGSSTDCVPFSTDYLPAVLATFTTTATQTDQNVCVGDSATTPTFTINTGWSGPPAPAVTPCSSLSKIGKVCPPPTPAAPVTCAVSPDSDGDGYYGVFLPTHVSILTICAAAGLTISTTLSPMKLVNATTETGTVNFNTVGFIFGSNSGATGDVIVTPDSTAVPVTAIKLAGDVPCSQVITHCAGVPCTP